MAVISLVVLGCIKSIFGFIRQVLNSLDKSKKKILSGYLRFLALRKCKISQHILIVWYYIAYTVTEDIIHIAHAYTERVLSGRVCWSDPEEQTASIQLKKSDSPARGWSRLWLSDVSCISLRVHRSVPSFTPGQNPEDSVSVTKQHHSQFLVQKQIHLKDLTHSNHRTKPVCFDSGPD